MAAITIIPDSVAGLTYDAFPRTGGSTKVDVMSDASNATLVSHAGTGAARQGWFWENVPGSSSIDGFDLNFTGNNNTANHTWRGFLRYGGGDNDSGNATNFPIGSWAERTISDWDTPTPAEFQAAEMGILKIAGADPNSLSVSETDCDVTFTPSGGGFILILAQWIPFLLPVARHGLTLRDMARALHSVLPNERKIIRPTYLNELDVARKSLLVRPVYV